MAFVSCKNNHTTVAESAALPYYNSADFMPLWLEKNDPEFKKLHQIPAFSLINQLGDTITERTFENKIYVTDFFFTICPGICSAMTQSMTTVQAAFEKEEDVLILSHSVTPNIDSVSVLKAYGEDKGCIPNKWHLVTGNKEEVYTLGRQAYFVEEDLGLERISDEFLHTENFVLIDKNRHIRGLYNGLNKNDVSKLIEDIKVLQME